ncbi:MAG: serine--tRNA ligase [Bacteroidota bacterium]
MLEISKLKSDIEAVKQSLIRRSFPNPELVDQVLELDESRKSQQKESDDLLAERNKASKEIGQLFKTGKAQEANALKERVAAIKMELERKQEGLKLTEKALFDTLIQLPNLPHPDVPPGNTDEDNIVFQAWEQDFPNLPEGAKPHWELAKDFNLIDFDLGAKITGAGFPLYKGKGARLQRALISFFLDEADKAGYLEVLPPYLVNAQSAFATGQLPDKEGQMYYVTEDDLYLIPTAEVPVTNIYRDVIVQESELPIKLTGYTPCFRREAGSYGAHVRGLNRVHQFDKVEIVQITHPDKSYDTLKDMLNHVEGLLNKLGLPFRILTLCGGDLGFASALTYDFEVFSAAQERWLEVSSVSNFETFQSNRLKVRFKNDKKKTVLAHTLNGSALALARIMACVLENNQDENGIRIPEVLRPYTGFDYIR